MNCPVCDCPERKPYVSTRALMHTANNEVYRFHQCASCESVYLTNPVNEDRLHVYYTENYLPYRGANAWGKYSRFVEGSQRKLDRKRVAAVQRTRPNSSTFKLLDIGCGNPSFLQLVSQKLNAKCTGIDFSDEGWKNGEHSNLELVQTSLADYQPHEKFDVITLWHFLEHDYHLKQTADKLYECLKPGGKVIIEVPDYQSWSARKQKEHWQGWHSPRHLTLFSPKSFQALFTPDRWSITKHQRYGTLDAFTLWWLGKMEQKQIDWTAPMENEFWPLVGLKVITAPLFLFERVFPMGVQLIVMEKNA